MFKKIKMKRVAPRLDKILKPSLAINQKAW